MDSSQQNKKETELQKQLRIKLSGLKRIHKEYDGYKKEEERQIERIKNMEYQGKDSHDINKQKEVLQETILMFPNVIQRLDNAIIDLENFIEEYSDNQEIKDQELTTQALQLITQMKEFLQDKEQ